MICDRIQMLEATLDLIEEGVAVLDERSIILFWNKAATKLTGYAAAEVVNAPCPQSLYRIDEEHRSRVGAYAAARVGASSLGTTGFFGTVVGYSDRTPLVDADVASEADSEESKSPSLLVAFSHKQGHNVPAMLRKVPLTDDECRPTGCVLLFFAVEEVDALPHGETGEGVGIERSQAEMEDRLEAAFHLRLTNQTPLGLLWITVDQAASLRKTHGRDACESMLRAVEQTLMRQMNPAEILGRWGDNEYLVLSHERTSELLLEHARRLAGQARTADFRWWGDRVGLTVSIGASYAVENDTLPALLNRARQAMQTSVYEGGNRATEARGN